MNKGGVKFWVPTVAKLTEVAYEQAGKPLGVPTSGRGLRRRRGNWWRKNIDIVNQPIKFPEKVVKDIMDMDHTKKYDYTFSGQISYEWVDRYKSIHPRRKWVNEFIRSKTSGHKIFTHIVSKNISFLDKSRYYASMCSSKFTLCPGGDEPWSIRFFEAIMCKSIPVVECISHTGRCQSEYDIGYTTVNKDETPHVYDQSIVESNFEKFINHQTFINI